MFHFSEAGMWKPSSHILPVIMRHFYVPMARIMVAVQKITVPYPHEI